MSVSRARESGIGSDYDGGRGEQGPGNRRGRGSRASARTTTMGVASIFPADSGRVRIDHVIWATADLDAAAARLERDHGLRAAGGGVHDGMGTHNRILPLGGGYLELLAVRDPEEAAGSHLGRAVTARLERT